MRNNYSYLSGSACTPSSTSSSRGTGYQDNYEYKYFPTNDSSSSYRKQWQSQLGDINTGYRYGLKTPGSYEYDTEYRNVKKLPDEYGKLRQTFDTSGNNRIKDIIAKYDKNQYQDADGGNTGYRKDKKDDKYYKRDFDQTQKKYHNEIQKSNRVSQEIKKLKEERKKRLEIKNKQYEQNNIYNGNNIYKNENLLSKQNQDKNFLQNNKYIEGFKKKNIKDDFLSTYKYDHKINDGWKDKIDTSNKYTKGIDLDYYKSKDYDIKSSKYDNYQSKLSKSTIHSTATSDLIQSKIRNKKKQQPVKYVQINNFILGKSIGEGKFGVVYQAFHKPTGWLFAIKKVPKNLIKNHLMVDQFILEIKLQTFLYQEYILSLYTHFDDKDSLYLVLEYMDDGTLFAHLKKNKVLGETEVAVKIKQIASAIKYLHENEIAHRDIKPQNIVLSHGVCKLCDFGWATICSDRRKTYCGTFDYAPPEILQGVQYDYTVDLWCLGVLTYELLVGKAPFYHISKKQTMKKILNVEKTVLEYPSYLSKNAINFIDSLIKKDPKQRLSSQIIMMHPFLKNAEKNSTNKY